MSARTAFLLVLIAFASAFSNPITGADKPASQPRNIILMIGDGLGLASLSATRYQKGRLAIEDMPHIGYSYTHSLDRFVTDSAASATALASGYRVANGQVAMHPDGTATKTLLEYAEEKGQWTGLVATSRVTHATPACMATHVANRSQEHDIAAQLAYAGVEVILGGGWDKFLPLRRTRIRFENPLMETLRVPEVVVELRRSHTLLASLSTTAPTSTLTDASTPYLAASGELYGSRTDGRDLITEMQAQGYQFVRTAEELELATTAEPRKILGLFRGEAMPRINEGRRPSLRAMSLSALRMLSKSPQGFFLMIEGSQIDWGGHSNDYSWATLETADFDDTLAAVRRFLKDAGIDGETLIVLTADHETGGLALNAHPKLSLGVQPAWSTSYHTGIPVPVFACGPGAESFGRVQDHAAIGRKLIERCVGREIEFRYPAGPHSPGEREPRRKKL